MKAGARRYKHSADLDWRESIMRDGNRVVAEGQIVESEFTGSGRSHRIAYTGQLMDGIHRGAQRGPRRAGDDALDPTTESLCDGYDQQEREGADGNTSHSSPCVKCEWVRADVTDLPYNTGRLATSPIQIGNRGEKIFLSGFAAGSETELQLELNDAGVRCADHLPETGSDGHARDAEVGLVEAAAYIGTEQHPDLLPE